MPFGSSADNVLYGYESFEGNVSGNVPFRDAFACLVFFFVVGLAVLVFVDTDAAKLQKEQFEKEEKESETKELL